MFATWKQLSPLRNLGRGGFGKVTLTKPVKSQSPDEVYVVKTVNLAAVTSGAGSDAEVAKIEKMIYREAEIMKNLNHEHIVKVFSSFSENGEFNIVMEYCECGTLKQAIEAQARNTPFTEEQICDWIAQISLTLLYLHDRQILHRDIKSENLLLVNDKTTVKLADFGIAKDYGSTMSKSAHTQIGTATHMTPEVLSGKHSYTRKSEVWALGVVLYELVMLRLPFPPNPASPAVVFVAILTVEIPKIPSTLPYTQGLRDLIETKMLVRDLDQRSSMLQVAGDNCLDEAVRNERSKQFQDEAIEQSKLQVSNAEMKARIEQLEQTVKDAYDKINRLEEQHEAMSKLIREQTEQLETVRKMTIDLFARQQPLTATKWDMPPAIRQRIPPSAKEKEAFFDAVWDGDTRQVQVLMDKYQIDVNAADEKDRPGDERWIFHGSAALIYAAARGHMELLRTLITQYGADVETADRGGATPLMAAAYFGNIDIVNALVREFRAKVEAKDGNGKTALWIAAKRECTDVIRVLVREFGAQIEKPSNDGFTPLIAAACYGKLVAVQVLVREFGAQINAKTKKADTALILASYNGYPDVVEFLANAGAKVNETNVNGKSALALAGAADGVKPEKKEKIVALLKKAGAKKEQIFATDRF